MITTVTLTDTSPVEILPAAGPRTSFAIHTGIISNSSLEGAVLEVIHTGNTVARIYIAPQATVAINFGTTLITFPDQPVYVQSTVAVDAIYANLLFSTDVA